MKKSHKVSMVVFFIAVLLFPLFLISCGGGGGGGGAATPGISYSGSTEQATINENNATEMATESYTNGSVGTAMSNIAAGQTETSEQVYIPRMLKVSNVLKDSLFKLDLTSGSSRTFVSAVSQETIPGSCGGTASYTINVNEQTGEFSGSFTYNSYCEGGVIISGSVDFFGQFDVDAGEFFTFEFSFNNLSTTLGGDSVTIKGDMSFVMTGPSIITLTMDILIKDSNNDVYWVEDYQLTLTEGGFCVDINISGTFYHPEHGFVTLSTVQVLTLCGTDEYPQSGELLITGRNGTTARIIFLSPTTYRVIADTNGNGFYDDPDDFDSEVSNWSDL